MDTAVTQADIVFLVDVIILIYHVALCVWGLSIGNIR